MNKYFIAGLVIIGGIIIYFLIPKDQIQNPVSSSLNEQIPSISKKTDVKKITHYSDSEKTTSQKTIKKVTVASVNMDKKIEEFIENHDLQSIKKVGDLEIFAQNLPQRNEFVPPSPPVFVKLKFKDKSEVLPLDSDLISSNSKIFIIKEKGDKYSEIKEIDTKKLRSFTPPGIGQN